MTSLVFHIWKWHYRLYSLRSHKFDIHIFQVQPHTMTIQISNPDPSISVQIVLNMNSLYKLGQALSTCHKASPKMYPGFLIRSSLKIILRQIFIFLNEKGPHPSNGPCSSRPARQTGHLVPLRQSC